MTTFNDLTFMRRSSLVIARSKPGSYRAMTRGMTPPYQRHCERSEAIHLSFARRHGLLRCARNDGAKHEFAFSRQDLPEVCKE
jgi:hypothetical protein